MNKINISNTFINEQFYPIVRNYKNINPNNIEIKEIIGDGNCLFRAISHFIKGNEYMYNCIRTQIYKEALNRINLIQNITIESERGNMPIHTYINTIKENGNYEGDFEISLAYDIFKINIAEYKAILDTNNNILNHTFIKYINDDGNENRDLLLFLSFNKNHFNLGYYNNTQPH